MAIPEYELGKMGKDKVSGFQGLIVGRCAYLYGCTQYCLAPRTVDKDGKVQGSEWFDEGRIALTDAEGVSAESVAGNKNGGPNRDAPRR